MKKIALFCAALLLTTTVHAQWWNLFKKSNVKVPAEVPVVLDYTNMPFEKIGSPMWVVRRDGSTSIDAAIRGKVPAGTEHVEFSRVHAPFYHEKAVQIRKAGVVDNAYQLFSDHLYDSRKMNVKEGDILVETKTAEGVRLTVFSEKDFLSKYVTLTGEEIKLKAPLSLKPEMPSRAQVHEMLAMGGGKGLNYALVSDTDLVKVELLGYGETVDELIAHERYRLAVRDGYVRYNGAEHKIAAGSLLKYKEGKLIDIIDLDYLKEEFNYRARFMSSDGVLSLDLKIFRNKVSHSIYEPHYGKATGHKAYSYGGNTSLGAFLEEYLRIHRARFFVTKLRTDRVYDFNPATIEILEGYTRYQKSLDVIKKNFPKRHTSPTAREVLEAEINIAKEARTKTRELIKNNRRLHQGEITFVERGASSLKLSKASKLKIQSVYRKIVHGTLLSFLVVGGIETVGAVLERVAEADNSAQSANLLASSVQNRDRYLTALKANSELLVYMPKNIVQEAFMRSDFNRTDLEVEVYLFNRYLEELKDPSSAASQLLARVKEEHKQIDAAAELERNLSSAVAVQG